MSEHWKIHTNAATGAGSQQVAETTEEPSQPGAGAQPSGAAKPEYTHDEYDDYSPWG